MLSWMRWVTGWFWGIVNSEGTGGGFLRWFSDHWVGLAVFLIIAGVILDWLIWMIRWRPHWLWLRKRQIIYEEVPVRKKPKKSAKSAKRSSGARPAADSFDDFDDPFSEENVDPYKQAAPAESEDAIAEWDSSEDPYARPAAPVKKVSKFGRQDPF